MPPSPRIKVTLDERAFERVCAGLGVTCPTVEFKQGNRTDGGGPMVYGDYSPRLKHIRVFLGAREFENDQLRFATTECVRTVLHELRHHWQYQRRPDLTKDLQIKERDAEGWAQDNVNKWKTLVRVSRSFPNSGFSRLNRHSR